MTSRATAIALLLCSTIAGCGGSGSAGTSCVTGADCESGFCKADGTCGPAALDGGDGGDGGSGSDAPSGVCTPNHDGVITADELPMAAGKTATFRIATNATWNTAGTAAPNNERTWDLSGALANDEDQVITLAAPAGTWWADAYPTATYAALLSTSSDYSGVFVRSDTKLELIGVVSPEGGTYKTELQYDGAAQVLAIPMQAGSSWSSSSDVAGDIDTYPYYATYTEDYESNVDAVGTMKTPYGEFPVVRIATNLRQSYAGTTLRTSRTFTWVAECFGPIATVTSNDESGDEFNKPAEVRRLAP